jgi:hypothetical protein
LWELPWAGRKPSCLTQGIVCRSGIGITLAAEPATSSGCFPQKVVSASRAAFYTESARFRPCALHSHSSHAGLVGHTEIFTFTSQRRSWPVVMTSCVEYSGKQCTQIPSGCPTKVQEIHPPRGSSRESMLPHLPTQI